MEVSIQLDGESFILARREIRNFYLRVRPDGTAHVSVPVWATRAQIEAFLRPRLPWLRQRRAALQTQNIDHNAALRDGGTLWLFGLAYPLRLSTKGTPGLVFEGNNAVLCCAPNADDAQRRELVEEAYRKILSGYLTPRVAFYAERMDVCPISVSIRLMRTRWGSCTPAAGRIRFNLRLAQKPRTWIDYVIVHELAHLRHADHSPAFWALVCRHFPDWHTVRRALNSGVYESL